MNNVIQLKKTRTRFTSKNFQKRAVAPVIATLLLVAIAVVGGSILFVFSQDFFATAQISGSPQIESVKILGYDATDGNSTQFHDGFTGNSPVTGDNTSDGLKAEEYIGVYLKNDGVNQITLSEIKLAGETYNYVDLKGNDLPDYTSGLATLGNPEYTIVQQGFDGSNYGITIDSSAPELQPGQQATLIIELDENIKSGRDAQLKLTTSGGSVFVGTVIAGQQSG